MNEQSMDHTLADEKLEQVSGGAAGRDPSRISPWDRACAHYECEQCGSHNVNLSGHNGGCTVPKFEYYALDSFVEAIKGMNSCWSCRYAVHGYNDPLTYSNLRCGYKG